MKARLLTRDDLTAIQDLMARQRRFFGLPINQFPTHLASPRAMRTFEIKYLMVEDNPYARAYGYFHEDALVGTISMDLMQDQPIWVLRRICVDEDLKGRNAQIVQSLMTEALVYAESQGYHQHLYLIPAKYRRAHAQIWDENPMRNDRYKAVELEYVEAHGVPKFRQHWELLFGRITYPLATSVRMSFLLDEHR